ncbi:polysaccharide deacetylase family protein [Neobacillus mesonae]|nr:polysaccharide deacetylase family protein [Neobacillus mesonae]
MKRNLFLYTVLIVTLMFLSSAIIPITNSATHAAPEHHVFSASQSKANTTPSKNDSPTLGQLRKKYSSYFLTNGPSVKKIALTFDDVPDPRFTPQVLDILKKYGVKATFFVNGHRIDKFPDLFKRIYNEGHAIGNHSYSHPNFNRLTLGEFVSEIQRTEQAVSRITGFIPKLIRPPYGEITEEQLKWAVEHDYRIVNWNVDSLDWKGISKNEVVQNIMSQITPGAIILQHAGGGVGSDLTGTIEALPEIITKLRSEGYEFVTVPELLGVSMAN